MVQMEGHLQKSPRPGRITESSDEKYVSGLSTVLVAKIQETKDTISQIEYIFCSQLYPNFEMNNQNFQKIHSEAREAAEGAYKQKEKDLLFQIKKLQRQNQQLFEDNKWLKVEKLQLINRENESCNRFKELQEELNRKTLEVYETREAQQNLQKLVESKSSVLDSYEKAKQELEDKNERLLKLQKKLELETEGLRKEIMEKAKEVDDTMKLQNKLLHVNQSNSSLILQKENQLKEYKKKTNRLVSKLEKMGSKVNELLSELREKTDEVEKGKSLQGNLLQKIESQATEIMDNKKLSNKFEKENRLLASKVTCLNSRTDELRKELGQKTSELEKVRKEHDQLLRQSDSTHSEIVKRGQALEEFQEEKKQLLEKVDNLQQSLSERTRESSEGMELHMKLLKQIEAKDSELLSEKTKMRDFVVGLKKLKSRYNYLCEKYNINGKTMLPLEGENEVMRHNQTPGTSHDIQKKASDMTCNVTKPVDDQEVSEKKKEVVLVQRTNPCLPITSHTRVAPQCPSRSKPCPSAGIKRPRSYWRDTRSHQSRVGPECHDDFLDTPLDSVRDDLGKALKEVRPDFPKPDAIIMCLDDQTDDINADAKPNKLQKSSPRAGTSGFKYVEPVRKKAERENLKGVECKQCKKFYDAVLPGAGDTDKQNIRCEHQDGVSRHRYRQMQITWVWDMHNISCALQLQYSS